MTFVLVSVAPPAPVPVHPRFLDSRSFWLESMDGSVVIPIAGPNHRGPWRLQKSATGLGVEPVIIETGTTPGVPGGYVKSAIPGVREVMLPLHLKTETQAEQFAAREQMFALTDPTFGMTRDGNFRLVCSSSSGTRQLTLHYMSGFEGDESLTMPWFAKLALVAAAVDPYPRDRDSRQASFALPSEDDVFLAEEGDSYPWPRRLTPTTVIGEAMNVEIPSSVPVYVEIEATGPMESFSISSDTGMSIVCPDPIGAGETLRIVTEPRSKSIRLDGEPAAGMIARGSRLAPLRVGTNVLDVTAPGGDEDTRLTLRWRGGYRTLW